MKLETICEDIIERVILDSDDDENNRLNCADLICGIDLGMKAFQSKKSTKIKSPLWEAKKMGGQLRQLRQIMLVM